MNKNYISDDELFLICGMSNYGSKIIEWLDKNKIQLGKSHKELIFLPEFLSLYKKVCDAGWDKLKILHLPPVVIEKENKK